ncbi:MAG: PAS domain S-box protein [Deltaproteobacteria bacterium]|nr:PAS domain S-box protein [Deltaproteobacteria bacterium]
MYREAIDNAVREVSQRKGAEQEMQNLQYYNRRLIETSPDSLVTFDQKGIILDVNEATIKATGRTREELIGTLFVDYFTDPEKAYKGAMLVFETGEVRNYELVMKGDGSETIVSYNASVYEDQTGQVVGAFAAARDITEQRRLEQEREVLLNELFDKNEELETFVYSVSHGLKTPIVTIEGFIGAMREDFGDQISEGQKEYIRYMSEAVLKMEVLIADLLEFSRIGRMTEKKSEFPFTDILEEVLKLLRPQIQERGIEVKIQDNLPDIYGEKKRFTQVMENLLTNAVKYIGKDNTCPCIDIGVQRRDGQNVFFVRDNGIGIEGIYFEKIFQVFQRLPFAKRVGEGTGIGLAIVKRIIENHGGSVRVTSKPGEGSTFFFTIKDKEI